MSDEQPEWTIEIDLQNVPEGIPVEVHGLGSFKNGGTYGIPNEMVNLYRLERAERDAGGNVVKGQKDPMTTMNHTDGIMIYPTAGGRPESRVGSESEEGVAQ
jgi:hypothetical protein